MLCRAHRQYRICSRFGKVTRSVVTASSNVTTDQGITHTTEFDYLTAHSYPPGDSSVTAIFLRRKRVEPGAPALPAPPSVPGAVTQIEEHTVYSYDTFGNLTETRECGANLSFCLGPVSDPPKNDGQLQDC